MATDQLPEDDYPDGIMFLAHWTAMSLLTWGALSVVLGAPPPAAFSIVVHSPFFAVFSAFITLLVMVAAFVTVAKLLRVDKKKRIVLVYLATILVSPAVHYALLLCLVIVGFPTPD